MRDIGLFRRSISLLVVILLLSPALLFPSVARGQDTLGRAPQDYVQSPYPEGLSTLLVTGNSTSVLIVTDGDGPITGYTPWQDSNYWLDVLGRLSGFDVDGYNGVPTEQLLSGYDFVIYTAGGYWYPLDSVVDVLRGYHFSGKPLIVVAPDINYDWAFHSNVESFCREVLHVEGALGIYERISYHLYASTGHEICVGLPNDIYVPDDNSWPDAFDPMGGAQGVLLQGSIPTTEFPVGSVIGLPSYSPFSPVGLYGVVAYPGSSSEGKVVTFGFVPAGIDPAVGRILGENVIEWLVRTAKERLGDALRNLMNLEVDLMFSVARARSQAYAKSVQVTKDFYDDLIQILLYTMTMGIDAANLWPNWHVSSHFKGIMDAVRNSPLLHALHYEHWLWQHGMQSEFIRDVILDFGGRAFVELGLESKTEEEIFSEHYDWMLNNFYDYGGLNAVRNTIQNEYDAFMATVPDDLPDKPSLDTMITALEETASGIDAILRTSRPNKVFWISDVACYNAALGDTLSYRDSTYAATLEALHDPLKTVNTVSGWTLAGAVTGYVLIKVVSAFATLGVGALAVEGILGLTAEAAAYLQIGTAVADLGVTFLTGRLYAETLATSIADLDMIRTVWSDSLKASQAAVMEAIEDPKGQIMEVDVPSVVSDQEIVIVRGKAKVVNLDKEAANIAVFALVYDLSGSLVSFVRAPLEGSEILEPSEVKTFDFDFTLFRSIASQKYVAEVYASIGTAITGPSVTTFAVCTPDQYTLAVSKVEETMQTGTISQGDVVSMTFTSAEDVFGLQFVLFYPFGRLDLHVYDEYGNHVGINYETDTVESQIAGSTYSGVGTSPQDIRITGIPSDKIFTIRVVGFQTIDEEGFTLMVMKTPSLPPVLDVFPRRLYFTNAVDPMAKFAVTSFNVHEFGGQESLQSVRVTITDLTDSRGHIIPSGRISIEPNMLDLAAGEFDTVTLNVMLDSTSVGTYTGTIRVEAPDQTIDVPVQFECVTLQFLTSNSLREMQRYISALPSDAFENRRTAPQMKRTLSNKIEAVATMVEKGDYVGAINKLLHDIRPKMDGDPTPKDWIVDPTFQRDLQNWIGWIIMDIRELQGNLS